MGNTNGRITIYDYQLRLLYWYQNNDFNSIRWLSFDLRNNLIIPESITDRSESKYYFDISCLIFDCFWTFLTWSS